MTTTCAISGGGGFIFRGSVYRQPLQSLARHTVAIFFRRPAGQRHPLCHLSGSVAAVLRHPARYAEGCRRDPPAGGGQHSPGGTFDPDGAVSSHALDGVLSDGVGWLLLLTPPRAIRIWWNTSRLLENGPEGEKRPGDTSRTPPFRSGSRRSSRRRNSPRTGGDVRSALLTLAAVSAGTAGPDRPRPSGLQAALQQAAPSIRIRLPHGLGGYISAGSP